MKSSMLSLFTVISFIFLSDAAWTAPSILLRVAVGKVSEVVLPEKVAKVIKGGAVDSVLVEVLENSVYVLPKTNTPADIYITGVSGESYPINLSISSEHDMRIEVKGAKVLRVSQEVSTNVMDLMKEILLGREPAGATILKTPQSVILNDGAIKMTVDVIYDFPRMAAYVFQAQNMTDHIASIPLQQISFPNLLAITADVDLLKPKGQEGENAKVYVIAGK